MIDVLKRLAELDDQNPNIVKESIDGAELAECGGPMSTMVNPSQPQMPASINVTAGSGQEVSDMLSAIMKLAGIEKVEPHHLGAEPEVATLTAEPVSAVGPSATAGDEMRSVMDKLNGADGEEDGEELSSDDESNDEETDEGQYDNSPADAEPTEPFDSNEFAHQENPQGAGKGRGTVQPNATTFEGLMSEYLAFIAETK